MATTYDNASLVMIPSGVKDTKAYSIKPTDGSGDFTFSRGSDIQATRVNSSGLIEKAKVNNLTYSNTFSSWSGSGISVTSGQSGYDGSSDAWLLDITGGAGSQYRGINVSATGVHTTSVYAKAGTLNWVLLLEVGGGSCYFDLQNGIVGTNSGTIDASIEEVKGAIGWYRISYTQNNTITQLRIYPATGNSNVSQTSGNILIQDAQLNHGLIAQDYVETTTTAVVEGLTADLPRLDYSGGASCPSLLLEPSRTNINTHSEYIDGWSDKVNVTLTANAATSPEGVDNAYKVYPTATGSAYFFDSQNLTNATDYTYSIFVKADGVRYYQLTTSGGATSGNNYANFDLQEGTKVFDSGFNDADIESYGNGWYRIYVVFTAAATGVGRIISVLIDEPTDGRLGTIAKNGTDGSLVYGSVYEAGSYPTSYIPTYGTAANRGADDGSKVLPDSILGTDYNEGTLFFEAELNQVSITRGISITSGFWSTSSVRMECTPSTGSFACDIVNAGVGATGTTISLSPLSSGDTIKCAAAWNNGVFTFYANGQSTSGTYPLMTTKINTLYLNRLGTFSGVGNYASNDFKQVLVFPTALTNAELAALTTI